MKVTCCNCLCDGHHKEMKFIGGISQSELVDICFLCETCGHAIRIREEDDMLLIHKLREQYWQVTPQ